MLFRSGLRRHGPLELTLWLGDSAATLAVATNAPLASAGAFELSADGLVPGSSYFWRIVLRDAAGSEVETDVASFTTPARSTIDRTFRSVTANQRKLTFRGRLSTLGAGTTRVILCLGRVPASDFVTDERHYLEVDETGLFEITLERDWDEEFAYTWAVTNDNGRQGWYYGYDSRNYNWVQVQDDQDYRWKGGEGSWTDPAMWETDGLMDEQCGYPRRGSTVRLKDGVASGTIHVPDDGTFYAKTVVVTNGQELTLHRDSTNWVRFAFSHTIANRNWSDGSIKVGRNGRLVLSGGTWYVDAREQTTGLVLSDQQHGTASVPGAALEVVDGADLRLRSRDSNNWPGFAVDYGYLHVGAGSRIYSAANWYAGAPGLVVRIEGAIETPAVTWNSVQSDRYQIGLDSLRQDNWTSEPVTDWEISGSSPQLLAGGAIYASSGGGDYSGRARATVKLLVPTNGFERPVFRHQPASNYGSFGGTGDGSGKQGSENKSVFVVPADAPAALARGVVDTRIVEWPTNVPMITAGGIAFNRVRALFLDENLPHPDTDYWYDTFDPVTGTSTASASTSWAGPRAAARRSSESRWRRSPPTRPPCRSTRFPATARSPRPSPCRSPAPDRPRSRSSRRTERRTPASSPPARGSSSRPRASGSAAPTR